MTRVFEGTVEVAYSQAYVAVPGDAQPSMAEMFGGQRNGLCGAAHPGWLFLVTGLHTGGVVMAVDVLPGPPGPDDSWEDVVEVSFSASVPEVVLMGWGGGSATTIPLGTSGSYRVRYSARGMDEAKQRDTRLAGDPVFDRYLLQFWPAPPTGDQIVRQTSAVAAYWHQVERPPARR